MTTDLTHLRELLDDTAVVTVCTLDADGSIHAAPLWFDHADGRLWISTSAQSRKVHNLRRDPRITLVVERGTHIAALDGAMIVGHAELIDDPETLRTISLRIADRYVAMSPPRMPDGYEQMVAAQLPERILIAVQPERITTWDTSKQIPNPPT